MRIRFLSALLTCVCFARAASAQTELVINSGFELANGGEWHISPTNAGAGLVINPLNAYQGNGYLTMGNNGNVNQTVYQVVTLPTNLISATFSFYYEVITTDQLGTDTLSAYIYNTNGTQLASLGSVNNFSSVANQGYLFVSTNLVAYPGTTNLSAYAGQAVELYFRVSSSLYGSQTSFNIDDVSFIVGTTPNIPTNDFFANSIALSTNSSVTLTATNLFATRETGEPKIANDPGGHSLWWTWTAPAIGTVSINTAGTTISSFSPAPFATLLGVYTGSSVSNLTLVAQDTGNDEANLNAQVHFKATAPGTVYQIAVDGSRSSSGTIGLNLNFSRDTRPPTVSIASPANGAKVTNSTVTVSGKASDSFGVTLVQWRVENSAGTNDYQNATGTNSWSATVTGLVPGPNTIRIQATDTAGNIATVARTVDFIVVSPLTVTISGAGAVSPNLNGRLLPIGSTLTLTAQPGPGDIFAGWSGDVTTNSAKLVTKMQTNMAVTATFITNPFPSVAATYQGLFYDTNVATQSAGFISITVTKSGSFTAKILLAGKTISVSGQLSAIGASPADATYASSKPVSGLSVQLQLDLAGAGITGQISDGSWTSHLHAFRPMTSPPAGKYTLLLPGGDGEPDQPGGDGFGALTVDSSANITFQGALGDGSVVAQKAVLTQHGQWPFFASLYSGKGLALGWLTFEALTNSDIDGQVSWTKSAVTSGFYQAGFTNQNDALGSAYVYSTGSAVLNFPGGHGIVWLANANLADPAQSFTNHVTLTTANKIVNGSTNALNISITTSSGLFKGSVVDPASGKPQNVSGVVLQKPNFGAGFFPGTTRTGRVRMDPAE